MKMRNRNHRRNRVTCLNSRFFSFVIGGVAAFTASLHAQETDRAPASGPGLPGDAATEPAATSMNTMSALNDQAKLSKGDRIGYRVVEEQKDPVVLMVSDSGELDVPLAGRIAAAGKTCKQLAYELKPLLEKVYFYHATVIIGVDTLSTQSRGKVYLTGQVNRQGAVEIPSNENLTVSKAILLVGGLADFADRRKVKLVRKKLDGTTTTTVVDMVEILDKGHADRDPVLQPDDMIIVPQRLINF